MLERRKYATLIFFFFGIFFTLTNSFRSSLQIPDEEYVIQVTGNLIEGRPLYLPDHVPIYQGVVDVGKNGKPYSSYQIGQSLLYAPFYWTAKRVIEFSEPYSATRYGGARAKYETWLERETRRYLYLCPALFSALTCAVFFLFALRLGFRHRTALVSTLLLGLGTMVWPYSRVLFTEATQTALLLSTIYLLFAQRQEGTVKARAMLLAGAMFGLLLSIRAVYAVLPPVLAGYWFFRNQDRRILAPLLLFAVPTALFAVPQLLYNEVRFGNILSLGYGQGHFSTPILTGLFGLFLSPGKSFFLYNPVSLLALFSIRPFWKRAPVEATLFAVISVLVSLKYAGWWVWSGNPCWGPRYLLVLVPFFLLVAAEWVESAYDGNRRIRGRLVLAAIFTASLGIQILGTSIHHLSYLGYVRRQASLIPPSRLTVSPATEDGALAIRDPYFESEFVPEYSPIAGHWWLLRSRVTGQANAALTAPWSGTGLARYHADVQPEFDWDIWLAHLVRDGLEWVNLRLIMGIVILLIVLTIVGQELFQPLFTGKQRD